MKDKAKEPIKRGNYYMSFKEIGIKLNLSESSIKKIYSEAMEKLKKNEKLKESLRSYNEG